MCEIPTSVIKAILIIYLAIASIIFYAFLIDKLGRRRPVIISSIACSLCIWYIGAYVKVGHPASVIEAGNHVSPSTLAGGRAATGMIMIFAILSVLSPLRLLGKANAKPQLVIRPQWCPLDRRR